MKECVNASGAAKMLWRLFTATVALRRSGGSGLTVVWRLSSSGFCEQRGFYPRESSPNLVNFLCILLSDTNEAPALFT
jgi:hypothetical protein